MSRSLLFSLSEPSRVAAIRREAGILAQEVGFNETGAERVKIVTTEAATNIIKHAGSGCIVLRPIEAGAINGLEVIAIDKGKGMENVSKCLEDGYSTAGSPGTGLGAASRMSDFADIYSLPGVVTVLVAQFWTRKRPKKNPYPLEIGAVSVPIVEGEPSGDAWCVRHTGDKSQLLVVDGLGHGLLAARAADQALTTFQDLDGQSPSQIINGLHGPLRATRGASLAVAEIDFAASQVRYAGVGNIAGLIVTDANSRSMVSHNGTVGHELHRVAEFNYPWSDNAMMIMHSDGLTSRWTLEAFPGLLTRHPSIIAAVLYAEYQRPKDDSTVVVLRPPGSWSGGITPLK